MGKDDNNNKKQQPQDNAAATASATAGALAAAGAPVSAIVKCKDYDHVFVTSRCAGSSYSVKSEDSDIDSDSDSDSDDDSDDDSESDSEEESCTDDDENQGFFQKFWPSEVSSRQIPRSVSFVTDDDSQETNKEEELELNENYEDMYYTD